MANKIKFTSSNNENNYVNKIYNYSKTDSVELSQFYNLDTNFFHKILNNKSQEDEILNLAEKTLSYLSKKLNQIYKVNFSTDLWRVLLSPIIIYLTQSFWYNYYNLNLLNKKKKYIFQKYSFNHKFTNSRSVLNFLHSKKGNDYIIYLILKNNFNNLLLTETSEDLIIPKNSFQSNIVILLKNLINYSYLFFNLLLSVFNNSLLMGIKSISFKDKFYFKFNRDFSNKKNNINENIKKIIDIDFPKISEDSDLSKRNEIIFKLISKNINSFLPLSIFKNFKKKLNTNNFIYNFFKLNQKKIIIGPLIGGSDYLKILIFIHKLNNKQLIIHQHGGYYGLIDVFTTMNFIEYKSADIFLTWGWSKHSNYQLNTIPLPVPYISKLKQKYFRKKRRPKELKKILFIGTEIPLFFNNYGNTISNDKIKIYINDKKQFLSNISNKYEIYYKPYFSNNTYKENKFIQNIDRKIKIINDNIENIFSDYDLFVVDHPSTLFNYCLGASVPTLFLFNEDIWTFSKEAIKEMQMLKSLNIVFDNPFECAHFINNKYFTNKIFDTKDKKNSKYLEAIINKYCNNSYDWQKIWNEKINNKK